MNSHSLTIALLVLLWGAQSAHTRAVAGQAAPLSPTPRPAAPATSPALDALKQDLDTLMRSPGVERGIWAIAVQSIDRSERLFELNPRTLMVPASVSKLVSTATAVDIVGWDHRYETTLQTRGSIDGSTLHGDLLAVGTGDPSIGGRNGTDLTPLVEAIRARGVTRIDGSIVGDDQLLEEPRPQLAWAWDDLGSSGTLYGALNYQENRMAVAVWPGPAAGSPAELVVDPIAEPRPLVNRVVTGERGTSQLLWTEQRPGEVALTIAGSIPAGASAAIMSVSVGNPTVWFARALRFHLIAAGIDVTGDAIDIDDLPSPPGRDGRAVLATHRSPPLADIVKPLMKDSVNLYGEALLRLNAPRTTPTNDGALEGLRARLTAWGIPADSQQLVDGSGLSRRNTLSSDTLVAVLVRMHSASAATPWMAALPLAGSDGTLQNRLRGTAAEKNVRAKTGSMSNIRSLAGYVTTRDGERLAFAIIVNNFDGPGASAVQAIDAIATRLATFSRKTPAGR